MQIYNRAFYFHIFEKQREVQIKKIRSSNLKTRILLSTKKIFFIKKGLEVQIKITEKFEVYKKLKKFSLIKIKRRSSN